MAYEQKANSGSLFRNDRKERDNQPDYRGTALINGVEYYMNAWLKEAKSGTKFFSFSFTPKAETGAKAIKEAKAVVTGDFIDDEVPF